MESDPVDSYMNFVCQSSFNAALQPTFRTEVNYSEGDLQPQTLTSLASQTFSDFTKVVNFYTYQEAEHTAVPVDGWYNFVCGGYRNDMDTHKSFRKLQFDSEIDFVAGYKVYQNSQTKTSFMKSPALTGDIRYNMVDHGFTSTSGFAALAWLFLSSNF